MIIKCTLLLLSVAGGYQVTPTMEESGFPYQNITKVAFVKIGCGYYYIETKKRTNLIDASESCHRNGAHLIVFETIEEWDLVNQYLFKNDIDDLYWTLDADVEQEGIFSWFSTGISIKLDIFNKDASQTNDKIEYCDSTRYILNELYVNEEKCKYECLYICEKWYPILESFYV